MIGLSVLVCLCLFALQAFAVEDACNVAVEQLKAGQLSAIDDVIAKCEKYAELEEAVNQWKRKLNDMSQKIHQLKSKSTTTAPIEPAMQWAQSPDSVFINVKFAHKLDAPACLDLVDPNIDIEESRVIVRAGCKGMDKHFRLDLVLFSSIVAVNSSWSMTSVGRGSFTLAKQVTAKWDRLLAMKDKPKNLHVWWAMQEKYDDVMRTIENLKDIKAKLNNSTNSTTDPEKTTREASPPPEEDLLNKDYLAAKKRVQDHARKAKKEIEDKATEKRAKFQKEIDLIDEEETKHTSKLDEELKIALSTLLEKFKALKTKKDGGEQVTWGDDDVSAEEEHREGSFFAAAAKVLKKAFGVEQEPKEEV